MNAAGFDEFIQISGANFVYQLVGGTYPGWPALKEKLLAHWSKVKDEVNPEKLIKIGLRYVNLVAKEPNHTHLRDWLQPKSIRKGFLLPVHIRRATAKYSEGQS